MDALTSAAMFERINTVLGKKISKIPGDSMCSKKEKQGYLDNLEKLRLIELTDLLTRQEKLLENRPFISKLPDKGEKIRAFRDKLAAEVDQRRQVDQAATLLSRLNIAAEGKNAMNELEWTGKYSETKVVELDSDDDADEDPLKILAQPTGSGVHKKKIITVAVDKSLITADDLKEIESIQKGNLLTHHVEYLSDMVEKPRGVEVKKGCFKPYKTTLSNVHDPLKEKERKQGKSWENTAATPPLIVHGAVKVLSIHESLTLEKERTEKVQEAQKLRAIERLAESLGLQTIGPAPENYRTDQNSEPSDTESEIEEVHDDDDDDKAGTVVFPVDTVDD